MDGFGFQACGLCQALGRTSRGCAQQNIHLLCVEDLENTGDNGRFANARPTGDHGDFTAQGHCHGIPL
jgi:hypothetical protein